MAPSKVGISVNKKLINELQKPVTKQFKTRKVYARFKERSYAANLAETELLSSKANVSYIYLLNMHGLSI